MSKFSKDYSEFADLQSKAYRRQLGPPDNEKKM